MPTLRTIGERIVISLFQSSELYRTLKPDSDFDSDGVGVGAGIGIEQKFLSESQSESQ